MKVADLQKDALYVDQQGNIYSYDGESNSSYEFVLMRFRPDTKSFIPSDIAVIFDKLDVLYLEPFEDSVVIHAVCQKSISDILEEFALAIKQKARLMDDAYSKYKGTYNAIDEDDVDEVLKQFKERY